jgi:transmembrane sensor
MNQLQKDQFLKIIDKYHAGSASKEEIDFLNAYYQSFGFRTGLTTDIEEQKKILFKNDLKTSITENILSYQKEKIRKGKMKIFKWSISVAATMVIAGAGLFYNSKGKNSVQLAKENIKNDIAPGGNRAILTLANGQKISLTDASNGKLAEQAGVQITKTADGQLIYTILGNNSKSDTKEGLNTIETPRGGQYQVRLPDGSSVWLNAESKITFPSSFETHKNRRIELSGEAYFEVAKDKTRPFIVKTENQEVEALGTGFNINSYTDESAVKTTLLHGSVKVTASNGIDKILKPGQQSSLSHNDLKVDEIDTELAIAWKNNNFIFESDDIRYIMRMIARWYNLEVDYVGAVPDDKFGGAVSKFENVSEVLKSLESTGVVKFRIEGRKIIVSK